MSYALNPKQIKAAGLLASGKTAVEVAKIVGVKPETISAWKNRVPNFEALLNRYNQEAVDVTIRAMQSNGPAIVATIDDLAQNAESEKVRLEAAQFGYEKIVENAPSGSPHPEDIERALVDNLSGKIALNPRSDKERAVLVRVWALTDPISDPDDGMDDEDDDEDEDEDAGEDEADDEAA